MIRGGRLFAGFMLHRVAGLPLWWLLILVRLALSAFMPYRYAAGLGLAEFMLVFCFFVACCLSRVRRLEPAVAAPMVRPAPKGRA